MNAERQKELRSWVPCRPTMDECLDAIESRDKRIAELERRLQLNQVESDCVELGNQETIRQLNAENAKLKEGKMRILRLVICTADHIESLNLLRREIEAERTLMEPELPTLEDIQKIYRDAATQEPSASNPHTP